MAKPSSVRVLEHCKVSAPSAPMTNSLALTFLDIPWLFFPPSQPLFFYEYTHPTSHFFSTTLPDLKRSLSLTLQHFFPFAGILSFPEDSSKAHIVCTKRDYVSFTVAESDGDFYHLTGSHPRDVTDFYAFVPSLETESQAALPLLAVQVTLFPSSGLCIGLAHHHAVSDWRTFNFFMKTWASFCVDSSFLIRSPPLHERTTIYDAYGLEETFLSEWIKRKRTKEQMVISTASITRENYLSKMVRATFVVSLKEMERIKQWILAQCKQKNQPPPVHLSPYVLTCAFIWVCLIKARTQEDVVANANYCTAEDPSYFGFVAGGLARLDYPVSPTYLGNCVGFGRSEARLSELMGEDGIIVAANVIGNKIKQLDNAMFSGAEKWIPDWEVLLKSKLHVIVSGSPKVDLYDTDFGWGRAKRIEEISIDSMRAISLTQSRDFQGGIEVGLALPHATMEAFTFLFIQGLDSL